MHIIYQIYIMSFTSLKSYGSFLSKVPTSTPKYFSDPTTISGCQLWLDATDSTSLVLSGSSVSQWNDKSGYLRNATKYGTSATNATYNSTGFNNLPSIQINSGQELFAPMPSGTIVSGMSVFVVFQKNGIANQYESIITRTTNNFPAPIDVYNTFRVRGNGVNLIGRDSLFNIQTATGLNLLSFFATSNLWDEYVNGSSVFYTNLASSFSDSASTNAIYIGTRGDKVSHFTGVISEVIVYNTVLTTSQRQNIEGYLAWKYNMNSSLTSGHPYRSVRP